MLKCTTSYLILYSLNKASLSLQRRTVASRLARFLHDKQDTTLLDSYLDAVWETTVDADDQGLLATFQAPSELADAIARFRPRQARLRKFRSVAPDEYDEFLAAEPRSSSSSPEAQFQEEEEVEQERPSVKVIMELHLRGYPTLPNELVDVLNTLQPTSVPSERAFSKARHARRFCQERQRDERFSDFMLLNSFYRQNNPLHAYATEHGLHTAPHPEPARDGDANEDADP